MAVGSKGDSSCLIFGYSGAASFVTFFDWVVRSNRRESSGLEDPEDEVDELSMMRSSRIAFGNDAMRSE